MSFWDLSNDEDLSASKTGEYDNGGGAMGIIPNNTEVLACIDEIKWDSNQTEDQYIAARWTILKPQNYLNRKIFQKMWVRGNNPLAKSPERQEQQGDKAKRMLAAIDANAGGKLAKSMDLPTDESLTIALVNKPMVIKLMTWSLVGTKGDKIEGNSVCAVSPKTKGLADPPADKESREELNTKVNKLLKKRAKPTDDPFGDDDIPF